MFKLILLLKLTILSIQMNQIETKFTRHMTLSISKIDDALM